MDADKRRKLIEVSYEIRACGVCAWARMQPGADWGTCSIHTYDHQKHTGPERELSVNRHGVCPKFTVHPAAIDALHGFAEFVPPSA